jgi:hypothetical protein
MGVYLDINRKTAIFFNFFFYIEHLCLMLIVVIYVSFIAINNQIIAQPQL